MSRTFKVWPKRKASQNKQKIDPSMVVTVVTKNSGTSPFMNNWEEVTETFKREYGVDIN